jgi:hypothetical protein
MSNLKQTKDKIKSQIEAIKRINDDGRKSGDLYDKFLKDLPTTDKLFGKKLSDYSIKKKNNRENKKDVFAELVEIIETIVGTNKVVEPADALSNKERLKSITLSAIDYSLKKSQSIIMDNVTKTFFSGDGICGTNKLIPLTSIQLKPSEFDFMNALTISPESNSGKIIYEDNEDRGLVKMNSLLYDTFSQNNSFELKDNVNPLFNMSWSDVNQEYTFSNLTGSTTNIETFLLSYYSNIEHLDISGVTKTAILMVLQGDGTESKLFDKSINDLNRLLNKVFATCSNPNTGFNQTPYNQFNENDTDIESYFDFDDIEGIDIDDETARYNKVLRFKDCNNYMIQTNPDNIEDFVYMSNNKNLNDVVNDILYHTAGEVYEKANQSQPLDNYHISLINKFILSLPRALIAAVLSPKYILPISMVLKLVNNATKNIKVIMKELSNLFNLIIKEIFWNFITEFWRLVKKELIVLLAKTAKRILKNKTKKYYLIVSSLITLLTKIVNLNIDNCNDLYGTISKTIDISLSGGSGGIGIPPLLLSLSDMKAGYSADRAFIDIVQRIQSTGTETGLLYGESNKLLDIIKSLVDGIDYEQTKNGKTISTNKNFITATTTGHPIIIPPGSFKIVGVNA